MSFLRTSSTRRLVAAIVGLAAAIAAGTAIAVAASSGGPVPKPEGLATALHQAASAPTPQSVTARITFTNNLIASSNLQGTDPILTGATGRLWATAGHLRLELQSSQGGQDAQVVVNNRSFWVYDPAGNTVYEGTLPAQSQSKKSTKPDTIPSVAQIQTQLNQLMAHLNLSGPTPGNTGGEPSYTVSVTPKHSGGLLGQVQLAWDAVRGVPLTFAVYSTNSSSPVLELTVTHISFGHGSLSTPSAGPPRGAKVVKVATPAGPPAGAHKKGKRPSSEKPVTGASAVAKHLSFKLVAPGQLDGLGQQSVKLLDWGGSPGALVTFGQNLGGIAVIEQTASSSKGSGPSVSSGSGDHRHGLSLPTVSINGATGTELDTAIGTVVRFTRGGVSYTVLGSVPPAAAEAAARAL